jgi:phytanoyl-CoA dioxygenase PhyH
MAGTTLKPRSLHSAIDDLCRSGYALLPRVLSPAALGDIRRLLEAVCKAERANGVAWPEPPAGQRVWMLLNKGAVFTDLVRHPLAVALADALIGAPVLLSNATANVVGPGAAAQVLHTDQGYLPDCVDVPMVLTALWLLDDFTETNGATRVLAGSHIGGTATGPTATVVAQAGSLLVLDGRLRHGAGPSADDAPIRRAVIINYCSPVLRQQENFWRSLDPGVFATADPLLRRLLGGEIYDSLGMVNGLGPSWRKKAASAFGPSWR